MRNCFLLLHPRSLELEVDEWLYLTGFHLNDCDYHHYENQGVDNDGHAHEGALAALREAVGDKVQHISQRDEREHMPVAGEHVDEELGVEIGENLREHHSQVAPVASEEKALAGDVGIAEEQPGKNHEVEGDEHHECPPPAAVHPLGASCDAHPHLVDDECDAMQCSPHHKVERCAVPLYVDATSAAKAMKIKAMLDVSRSMPIIVKVNQLEAVALSGIKGDVEAMARWFVEKGVTRIYITMGARGVYCHDGSQSHVEPSQAVTVVNSTGAGDAFMAAVVHAELSGATMQEVCSMGVKAAALALQSKNAVNDHIKKLYL